MSKNLGSCLGAIFFHFLSEISEELSKELDDELEYYFFLNLSLFFFSLLLDLFAILKDILFFQKIKFIKNKNY